MNRWFSVKILMACTVDEVPDPVHPLREQTIRLIQAESMDDAGARALVLGKSLEHSYVNQSGEIVSWRFAEIMEIQDLSEATVFDGMEVWSEMSTS